MVPSDALVACSHKTVELCGWEVRIRIVSLCSCRDVVCFRVAKHAFPPLPSLPPSLPQVENPNQLIPATIVIALFDLTNEESFHRLNETLELAQRVSPTALRAVVGTKADLQEARKVSSLDAVVGAQQRVGEGG